MIKYFHELTDAEFEQLKKQKLRWSDLPETYSQPVWCDYPYALNVSDMLARQMRENRRG